MKRILSLILAFVMIFSLVSCSSQLSVGTEEEEAKTQEEKTEAGSETEEEEEVPTESKLNLPEGFTAGYARVDITPKVELPIYDASVSACHDSLMLSCTAVSDGEKVALLMSADLKGIQYSVADAALKQIEKTFGIPADMIMISATHTHSAPTAGGSSDNMTRWLGQFYKQVILCVQKALQDLAPAEAYAGVSHTDGITFVRRYLLKSGKYQTNPKLNQADPPVAHESEADNELRTIRLAREGKKDILMMNFQTHYGLYVEAYSADFVHYLRQYAEKEMDVHFVYYSGASGNLNMSAKFPGEAKTSSKDDSVKVMWQVAKDAISKEVKLNTGKVVGHTNLYEATILQNTEEEIRIAKELDKMKAGSTEKETKKKEYGIASDRWIQGVITRAGIGETQKIPFTGISFGELAFTSSPIEQFDANAKWVRDNSPFKMTFSLSLTNGSFGYVPTAEAFPHESYEVYVCRYRPGSGEEFAQEQLRLLNLCYNEQ